MSKSPQPSHDHSNPGRISLAMLGDTPLDARLLEEVNHRARNNMAIICALLEMEMLHAPEALQGRFLASLARIRSLAVTHNLYLQDAALQVDIGAMARSVTDNVTSLFGYTDHIDIAYPHPIYLHSRRATYLGLALTEFAMYLLNDAAQQNNVPPPPV